jgi:hypothetical protein
MSTRGILRAQALMSGCLADINRDVANLVRQHVGFREHGLLSVDRCNDGRLSGKLMISDLVPWPDD